ncbi:MAG: hypothetical protein NUV54_00300, partial [Candidatus Taylorbacteria bacterium]|nr:hypothetical protein [Candidatus Taylorbacteria bacterium]
MDDSRINNLRVGVVSIGIVLVVLIGFLFYENKKVSTLSENLNTLKTQFASSTETLAIDARTLAHDLAELRAQTSGLSSTLSSTQQNIDAVRTQVGGVEQTVGSISGTVGTLQKLAKTDPELLKKYSKVYFMNENYVPAHLFEIPVEYRYSISSQEEFLTEAWPYLRALMDSAKA